MTFTTGMAVASAVATASGNSILSSRIKLSVWLRLWVPRPRLDGLIMQRRILSRIHFPFGWGGNVSAAKILSDRYQAKISLFQLTYFEFGATFRPFENCLVHTCSSYM